jgi:hypothetical protein
MVRVKTWWKPYLTLLLEGILLSFELWRLWRILVLDTLFFFSFFLFLELEPKLLFLVHIKDCWSNDNEDNDKV